MNNVCQAPPPVFVYQADEFYRDYEAVCSDNAQLPVWREIQWKGAIPAGTSVDFSVQTADTEEGLDNAPAKLLVASATSADLLAWSNSAKAVDEVLRDAGLAPGNFIRLTIRLNPSSDGQSTPTITDWRQLFDCKDAI